LHPTSAPPRRRWNRHPGTVEVPAVGEGDVGVVDALVCHPERLALLEAHVASILLPRWERIDGRPSPHVILEAPEAAGAETPVSETPALARGGPANLARAAAARRLAVMLGLPRPRRHLHGACACSAGVGCGGGVWAKACESSASAR
jgi:hypothetical protein